MSDSLSWKLDWESESGSSSKSLSSSPTTESLDLLFIVGSSSEALKITCEGSKNRIETTLPRIDKIILFFYHKT